MMTLKVSEDIDLNTICKGWKDSGETYEIESPNGEKVSVNKFSRKITFRGYTELLSFWIFKGYCML